MALDYANTSITIEQQSYEAGSWFSGYSNRQFDIGLLSEGVARRRLDEFRKLRPNWDGEGAESLSALTLRNAQNIALQLSRHTHFPDITPNAGDTITFEWESDLGSALMEIGHETYSFLMKTKVGKRSTDTGFLDRDADIAALGSLIQRTLF
ncbi:hypothetical protein [Rudaea sp.]|uniref:hypothetical protein n=1 Tax=Rudaea sp. TaxID=2136325 RepID=UPI00378321BA